MPTAFGRAVETVADAILRLDPALVILVGQAGGRTAVCVERVGINVDDARIADNAGAQPIDEAIAPSGPAAHFATVPIKAMVAAMRKAGVPADVSNTAGTFVCNHLLYGVLHFLATSGRKSRAGFIHVPWLDRAGARPARRALDGARDDGARGRSRHRGSPEDARRCQNGGRQTRLTRNPP